MFLPLMFLTLMLPSIVLFLLLSHHLSHLHSFPTRRSSDLKSGSGVRNRAIYWIGLRQCGHALCRYPGYRKAEVLCSWRIYVGHSRLDRKSTRLNSSHDQISYAVFCLKKKYTIEDSNVLASDVPNTYAAVHCFVSVTIAPPLTSTLFPYTTLFRSQIRLWRSQPRHLLDRATSMRSRSMPVSRLQKS